VSPAGFKGSPWWWSGGFAPDFENPLSTFMQKRGKKLRISVTALPRVRSRLLLHDLSPTFGERGLPPCLPIALSTHTVRLSIKRYLDISSMIRIAQNPLHTFPCIFPVDGEAATLFRTCCGFVCDTANRSATSRCNGIWESSNDTTQQTFPSANLLRTCRLRCRLVDLLLGSRQLVIDLLRGS